ncbi:hypothetical protein SA496_11790 [Pseudomonas sp. JS3066]|jgi:hypothetical protein|uniref:hypothetical protein n=1 Tax=unclassified Pseudomonas TaxID=196821 RepID=UPI000EA83AF0|nr:MULTISPECIES: hypothetical protein [unclassified Pseudomonas]AYF86719.1 hypothetical protein D6Z43_05930 [Pseudomonas sp. DY-1]MDH4653619.1 hypothetical protein [Pseudomonas sp. BN606]MRK22034.1 hypothetical protein [Pseudomonas sp. JG-B]WVK95811.1 hypothetical protein SA496_11790 [Pseudomonas sp. JS3066]
MRLTTLGLATLLCSVAPASLACGYDGMAMDLSLAHPASLDVALAVNQAYQDKLIAKPLPLPGGFGMRRALKALERVASTLPPRGEDFSLLLVEPGLWTRFELRDGRWQFTPHTSAPAAGENAVIVGEGALLAIMAGKLAAPQALERGLVHVEGERLKAMDWQSAFADTGAD